MMRRASLAILAAVIVTVTSTHGQTKRFITEKDLFKFTWIADPQISPDGATVAFARVTVNEKDNKYETSLFAVPSNGSEAPRRLTIRSPTSTTIFSTASSRANPKRFGTRASTGKTSRAGS